MGEKEKVTAVLGTLAQALELSGEETARALEANEITMELLVDEKGKRFISASFQGRTVGIYPRAAPEAETAS